jgi:hypothetical protein
MKRTGCVSHQIQQKSEGEVEKIENERKEGVLSKGCD